VEACTITAPDVITAFAVPNPDHSSQSCRFFRFGGPAGYPTRADHPIYFGLVSFIEPTLSIVDIAKAKLLVAGCRCRFSVQTLHRVRHHYEIKSRLESVVCRVWKPNSCVLHKLSTTTTNTTHLWNLPSSRISTGQPVFCSTPVLTCL
jgi:hypothetical protein